MQWPSFRKDIAEHKKWLLTDQENIDALKGRADKCEANTKELQVLEQVLGFGFEMQCWQALKPTTSMIYQRSYLLPTFHTSNPSITDVSV